MGPSRLSTLREVAIIYLLDKVNQKVIPTYNVKFTACVVQRNSKTIHILLRLESLIIISATLEPNVSYRLSSM